MVSTGSAVSCLFLKQQGIAELHRGCDGERMENVVNILSHGEPDSIEGRLMIVTQRWEVMAWSLLF